MQIFIRLTSNKNIVIEVDQQMSCKELKAIVQDKEGIPEKNQMLTFGGMIFYDGMTLADMNVQREDTVQCRYKVTYDSSMRW